MSAIYDIAGTTSDSFMMNGKVTFLQGDTDPQPYQGVNGDYYFQSNGSLWAKRNNIWLNLTGTALPDASQGPNKLLYSNGEIYAFANIDVSDEGKLITDKPEIIDPTIKKQNSDLEGGQIYFERGDKDPTSPSTTNNPYIDFYNGGFRFIGQNSNGNLNIPLVVDIQNNKVTTKKPSASSSKSDTTVPTIGWVNDPATATNVVHRSGNETVGGQKTFTSGIKVSSLGSLPGQLIAQSADYGFIVRNDNSNTYFLLTNQSDKNGSWNSLRPMYINNSTGNVNCNTVWTFSQTIQGTAYRAQWGDLAEYYEADEHYMPGTLVKFGGSREVTIANDEVNAVVTSNPAVIMNGNQSFEHPCPIALVGRVPVRVIGKCNKFDYLTLSEIPGVARALEDKEFPMNVIARALEDKDSEEEGLVLCVVKFEL